jgi:hypothetical protein
VGATRRQQLVERLRKMLRRGGKDRFVPMWARLHVYERNPAIETLDLASEEVVPPALPGELQPQIYGGVWDNLLQEWVPDQLEPERAEDVQVFPCFAQQVPIITFDRPPIMRLMILGGPGSGKTTAMAIGTLLRGGGLLKRRSHLTWGMVGATTERVLDPLYKDLFGLKMEPGLVPESWVLDKCDNPKAQTGVFGMLVNGCHFPFMTGMESSKQRGSKIQGKSWHGGSVDETQNVHDRVQMDIDERGRREGRRYFVMETATNFGGGHFEMRKERYKNSPFHEIVRLNGVRDNVFVEPGYWKRFEGFYSDSDWKRRMLAEDVPPEQVVYSGFTFKETLRPAPRGEGRQPSEHDVTRELTGERFGRPYNWVVGTDWGTLCTVSIWLKAFRSPKHGDIEWWAMHEITSGSHTHAGQHAKKLAEWCHPGDFIVVADPGINTKDVDKSDYELARREGLTVRPAHHEPIRIKHRISMLNALLCDASNRRRFFIDCDSKRIPTCPRLVQSFLTQQYDERGNPENVRKDGLYSDPTHWPAATAYGLFPFERIRGRSTFDLVTGGVDPEIALDPVLVKARQIHDRRSM